jgi:hypothetical protein
VQRALNLALADRHADDGMNDLFVEEVSPAPDCGHLLVHLVIPADRSVTEAVSALSRDAPRLRSEVAMAITRKRALELSFVPALPDGGEDGRRDSTTCCAARRGPARSRAGRSAHASACGPTDGGAVVNSSINRRNQPIEPVASIPTTTGGGIEA